MDYAQFLLKLDRQEEAMEAFDNAEQAYLRAGNTQFADIAKRMKRAAGSLN